MADFNSHLYFSPLRLNVNKWKESPNDSGRDEEDDGSKQESEALHEVPGGWVERVKEAAAHKVTRALHAGHRSKQGAWRAENK